MKTNNVVEKCNCHKPSFFKYRSICGAKFLVSDLAKLKFYCKKCGKKIILHPKSALAKMIEKFASIPLYALIVHIILSMKLPFVLDANSALLFRIASIAIVLICHNLLLEIFFFVNLIFVLNEKEK